MSDEQGITITEIEAELNKRKTAWTDGVELRELATLFAILKVGHSFGRLARFTQYPTKFLMALLDELRLRNLLITSLSAQFVLTQCPGSEDLIAVVTGARVFVRPEAPKPKLALPMIPQSEPEKTMPKTEVKETEPELCHCGRPSKHRGQHKGQAVNGSNKTKRTAVLKVAPVIAEKRAPVTHGSGQTQRSEKTIAIGGGRLTLIVDVNLMELRGKERDFVFALIDQVQAREAA